MRYQAALHPDCADALQNHAFGGKRRFLALGTKQEKSRSGGPLGDRSKSADEIWPGRTSQGGREGYRCALDLQDWRQGTISTRRHRAAPDRHPGFRLQKPYQHRPAVRLLPGGGGDFGIPSRWPDATRSSTGRTKAARSGPTALTVHRATRPGSNIVYCSAESIDVRESVIHLAAGRDGTGQCHQVLNTRRDRARSRPSEKAGSAYLSVPSARAIRRLEAKLKLAILPRTSTASSSKNSASSRSSASRCG